MKRTAAVIGAGFAGLAAAWDLIRQGYEVTVFEAGSQPGGLASGMHQADWQWSLEYHYHHIFQTDQDIVGLLSEMGLADQVFFSNTKTRSFFKNRFWQLDSPVSLLQFRPLSLFDRLRVGLVLAGLKLVPNGTFLEAITAARFLRTTMGQSAWQVLWQPLFVGKFGRQAAKINMAWFWARIRARSQQLGYFRGGFLTLAEKMVKRLTQEKVKWFFGTPVKKITSQASHIIVHAGQKQFRFDLVIATLPSPFFSKLTGLSVPKLSGLAALTMVLELDRPFFADDTYWLNIHDPGWPFLAVVEHTNLAGSRRYGGKHLVYVGKYLSASEPFFSSSKQAVMKRYAPYLKRLAPGFSRHVTRSWLFKAPFAQPLVFLNHSRHLPPTRTRMPGLFWTSLQHVYPWDRGTNYAVRFGRQAAAQAIQYLKKLPAHTQG